MFIPDHCPKCKETANWYEVDDGGTLFRIGAQVFAFQTCVFGT